MDTREKIVAAIGLLIIIIALLAMTDTVVSAVADTLETADARHIIDLTCNYQDLLNPSTTPIYYTLPQNWSSVTIDFTHLTNSTIHEQKYYCYLTYNGTAAFDSYAYLDLPATSKGTYTYQVTSAHSATTSNLYYVALTSVSNVTFIREVFSGQTHTDVKCYVGGSSKITDQDASGIYTNIKIYGQAANTVDGGYYTIEIKYYGWGFTGGLASEMLLGLVPFIWCAMILIVGAVMAFELARS